MKKGDTIIIYEDPLTQKIEEGKARLLSKIKSGLNTGDMEYWKVKFLSDGFITDRRIKIR